MIVRLLGAVEAVMSEFLSDAAEDHFVDCPSGRLAFRRFGVGAADAVPLVLFQRFRGTIDHWDPFFLERLAAEREVIVFDNAGVNLSSGDVPHTIVGMARGGAEFVEAIGLAQVDLLGWSMGGFVVQSVALERPELVRRLVVAGSGPGPVPGTPAGSPRVGQVAGKPVNDDEDFLFMLFPDTHGGRTAGITSLRRLDTRLAASGAAVAPAGVGAQSAAMAAWSRGEGSSWDRLDELALPMLVGNGAHDVMIHSFGTYSMGQRLPQAKIVMYSDAGHGFLFQHAEDFSSEVLGFLNRPRSGREYEHAGVD